MLRPHVFTILGFKPQSWLEVSSIDFHRFSMIFSTSYWGFPMETLSFHTFSSQLCSAKLHFRLPAATVTLVSLFPLLETPPRWIATRGPGSCTFQMVLNCTHWYVQAISVCKCMQMLHLWIYILHQTLAPLKSWSLSLKHHPSTRLHMIYLTAFVAGFDGWFSHISSPTAELHCAICTSVAKCENNNQDWILIWAMRSSDFSPVATELKPLVAKKNALTNCK